MIKFCTHGRDGSIAMRRPEQSLRRLETDNLDPSQFHDELCKSTLK
jgi:hypothetical protein